MGVSFSTTTVAQAPVPVLEPPSGSIVEAKSAGPESGKKSSKKSGKNQKVKKNKRGKSKRPQGDSTYNVITS